MAPVCTVIRQRFYRRKTNPFHRLLGQGQTTNIWAFLTYFQNISLKSSWKGHGGVESTERISSCIIFREKAEKEYSDHEIKTFLSEESGCKTKLFHRFSDTGKQPIFETFWISFWNIFIRENLVVKPNHFIACSDTDKQPPQKPLLSWAPTRI